MYKLEIKFTQLLNKLGKLPQRTKIFAQELVDANESAIALETICNVLHDEDIPISQETFDEIEALAKRLTMQAEEYDFIKELIQPEE